MAEPVAINTESADFAAFFHAHYETLLRAMYLLTGNRYEAEELAQDALVKACERWEGVSSMDNPVGYLYRTAVNTHKSRLRHAGLAVRRVFSQDPSDPISESDDRDEIRRALASLPLGQREALVLVEWLGLSDEEAGRLLGVTAGAVRVRISRARASLRPITEGTRA